MACLASMNQQEGQEAQQQGAGSFRVFRVTGDGACMFRAIAQGVQMGSRGSSSPMTPQSETQAALNLRKAVVDELAKRRAEIEPFIPGILDGDVTFEAYLERMAHPAAWGGEPEMVMACNILHVPINVWRITPAGAELIVTYGQDIKGEAPINLLWHSAGHYANSIHIDITDHLASGGSSGGEAAP